MCERGRKRRENEGKSRMNKTKKGDGREKKLAEEGKGEKKRTQTWFVFILRSQSGGEGEIGSAFREAQKSFPLKGYCPTCEE